MTNLCHGNCFSSSNDYFDLVKDKSTNNVNWICLSNFLARYRSRRNWSTPLI